MNPWTMKTFEIKLPKSKNWKFLKCQTHKFPLVDQKNTKKKKKHLLT